MSFNLYSPEEIMLGLAARAKDLRLSMNLSQTGLAQRSGVTLASLKRFEHSGEISLKNLLGLALVLNALTEFQNIFANKLTSPKSLDELLKENPKRKRGKVK